MEQFRPIIFKKGLTLNSYMYMRTHYINQLSQLEDNTEVEISGWLHEVRVFKKIVFAVIRDKTGFVQVTAKRGVVPDEVVDLLDQPKETVLRIKGRLAVGKGAKAGFEIIPSEVEVLGKVYGKVPFDVSDPEKVPDLDFRLDNRHVDLRRPEIQSIFRVRATVQQAFREYLIGEGFDEIVPTVIVSAATEGGTDLFPIVYFDKEAFLAQSPQLYKQLAVIGGMDKVFMQVPVFRAEPHNTTTHLNEIYQMDVEIGFADDDHAMDVLEKTFLYILRKVRENHKEDFDRLGVPLPEVPDKIPRYTYSQLVDLLREHGENIEWGDDFTKAQEKKIYELLKEDLYFITKWPTDVRAFYSHPEPDNPGICRAFDLIYKGLEISSGAQRIHDPELLTSEIQRRGMNPENFEFYIRSFKAGAPPHAGWSLGAERITMQLLNLPNIRETVLFPRDQERVFP